MKMQQVGNGCKRINLAESEVMDTTWDVLQNKGVIEMPLVIVSTASENLILDLNKVAFQIITKILPNVPIVHY